MKLARRPAVGPVACVVCDQTISGRAYEVVRQDDQGHELGPNNYCSNRCRAAMSDHERALQRWQADGKQGPRPVLNTGKPHCQDCQRLMLPEDYKLTKRCTDCSSGDWCPECLEPLDGLSREMSLTVCSYCFEDAVDRGQDPADFYKRKCSWCLAPLTGRANKEYCDTKCRLMKRRERERQAGSEATDEEKRALLKLYGGCIYCGSKVAKTFDHFVPLIRGGTNEIANLVPCCKGCNSKKGTKSPEQFLAEIEQDMSIKKH